MEEDFFLSEVGTHCKLGGSDSLTTSEYYCGLQLI